jgi:hypothetical protein
MNRREFCRRSLPQKPLLPFSKLIQLCFALGALASHAPDQRSNSPPNQTTSPGTTRSTFESHFARSRHLRSARWSTTSSRTSSPLSARRRTGSSTALKTSSGTSSKTSSATSSKTGSKKSVSYLVSAEPATLVADEVFLMCRKPIFLRGLFSAK